MNYASENEFILIKIGFIVYILMKRVENFLKMNKK